MACPMAYHNQIRRISQAALDRLKVIPRQRLFWKAGEDDPRRHTEAHSGLFYQLPDEKTLTQIFGYPSPFPRETARLHKTLGQAQIMIRKPALTAIELLKNHISQSGLNTKLLFHGDLGQGKMHTITHLVHYLHLCQEHLIVQIRNIKRFTRSPIEFGESVSRPGRVDTPLNAAILLQQIRTVNADLLERHKDTLICSQDYKWSLREVTKAGEPLSRVAEHGVNRVNHASDCVAVLLKELTMAADAGKIKLAFVVGNLRYLYQYEAGVIKHADFRRILVDEITVARALKKLIKNRAKNALVLTSCHDDTSKRQNLAPEEVLGQEAMDHLDGCNQIHVPKYSRQEFENCMNYYQDIGWICRPEARTQEARDELRFISGSNPKQLEYLCRAI